MQTPSPISEKKWTVPKLGSKFRDQKIEYCAKTRLIIVHVCCRSAVCLWSPFCFLQQTIFCLKFFALKALILNFLMRQVVLTFDLVFLTIWWPIVFGGAREDASEVCWEFPKSRANTRRQWISIQTSRLWSSKNFSNLEVLLLLD